MSEFQRIPAEEADEVFATAQAEDSEPRSQSRVWLTGVEHDILGELCLKVPLANRNHRLFLHEPTGQICLFSSDFASWVNIQKRQALANAFERILGLEFWKMTDKGPVRCNPPKEPLERFLALGDDLPLPRIKEFIQHPIVAQDGTLVIQPGLHPSGIFYRPNIEVPKVPERPTLAQVRTAVGMVEQLIQDFPFADHESRQAWWAYLLTSMLAECAPRPWPLFNFSANVPGSGKGLLAKIPGLIVGISPAVQAVEQGSDAEIRKVLTSELASGGGGWLILDNLRGRLDSPSLEAFLTCDYWTDRILGSSKKGKWRVRTAVALTANNLRLTKDLERRQVLIRIVSRTPEPELRNDFKIPSLPDHVAQRRERLLWSLCVILQNWLAQGRPAGKHRLGSFERWSEAIGGLLDSAEIGSEFLATKRTAVVGDREPWQLFVEAWVASTVPLQRQSANELVRFARSVGINLADQGPAKSLGRQLWKQHERPFRVGDQIYTLAGKPHGKQTLWSLVRAEDEKNPKNPTELYEQGIVENPMAEPQNLRNPTNGLKSNFDDLKNPTNTFAERLCGVLDNTESSNDAVCGVLPVFQKLSGVSQDAFAERVCGVSGVKNGISHLRAREEDPAPDRPEHPDPLLADLNPADFDF